MIDPLSPEIVVIGSINLDVVVPVAQLPMPGQTVLGGGQSRHHGGKGATQALAVARLGRSVALIGRVGADESGPELVEALAAEGVQTRHVTVTHGVPTGRALVAMDPAGENTVIITPGANGRLMPGDCEAAKDVLASARVTLLQQEVPRETNQAASRIAGGFVIVNPAPVRAQEHPLPGDVDIVVPNRGDLAALLGLAPTALSDTEEIARAARALRGANAVLVTLGSEGALLVEGTQVTRIKPFPVDVVDRAGADDCFRGALACALADGEPLAKAAAFAAAAAALSTTRPGSQPALPTRDEVERFLTAHR